MSSGGSFSMEPDQAYDYLMVTATALCCYEYLLTFTDELKYVWGRRFSVGSALFILSRYANLAASLVAALQVIPWYPSAYDVGLSKVHSYWMMCRVSAQLAYACVIIGSVAYVIFAALRMYVIYGMSRIIFALVFLLGLLSPCIQCYLMSASARGSTRYNLNTTSPSMWKVMNCSHAPQIPGFSPILIMQYYVDSQSIFLLVLRSHAIVFEGILLALTWNKTLLQRGSERTGLRLPFTTILLQNGTLYFIAIALTNGTNLYGIAVGHFSKSPPSDLVQILQLSSPLLDSITSICMCRFLLNLFAAARGDYDSEFRSSRWNSVLRFAQLENLGATLRNTHDYGRDEDSNENVWRDGRSEPNV